FRAILRSSNEQTKPAPPALRNTPDALPGAAARYPRNATIAQLFEETAAAHAASPAATFGTQTITYAELNARANRLAHRLR
ncbi:hypothetical protein ACMWQD_29160, partial [Escherichia coli]|uniref:hypothetical protein n=1 Tax=Escherichia coli TaxID=562 RepID=UPI0039E1A7C5